MSKDSEDLTIDDILDSEEIEELGEQVNVDPLRSTNPVAGLEARDFESPETTAFTGGGFNMAKGIQVESSPESEEGLDPETVEFLDKFARNFGKKGENAVYIRDKVLDLLEEDRASAFMKFKGIGHAYPVTLRAKEDLDQEIESSEYEFADQYVDEIEHRLVSSNFVVPAIYAGENYFPRKVPVTVVYRPDDAFVVSPDDPSIEEGIDDFDKGDAGFSDHPHIEEWWTEEGYGLIIDSIGAGIESPAVEISGDEFIVYDGEDEVYRASPEDFRLEEKPDGDIKGELRNGVYNVRI